MVKKPKAVAINGVEFRPMPGVSYKWDYLKAAKMVNDGVDFRSVYRPLILDDLFFLLYFVVKPFNPGETSMCNHPFVVNTCREVESGPGDYTLDIWAREHYKSSIITIAETIRYILANPGAAVGIFSYARPVAKKFLFTIKEILTRETMLIKCFPDVLYEDPVKESPLWSLDEGIIVKRSGSRKEATVSAWGLVEGMPTGLHFDRRVYDDIVTEDIAESIDTMEKVKLKFDSSQNLGTIMGHHRVVGTYYHYSDPLTYIRDKKGLDGRSKYHVRLKPATVDGSASGVPVLLPQGRFDDLKLTRTFNCQQLLNPVPESNQKLKSEYLIEIPPEKVPANIYKFMLVDQAGDMESNKKVGDSWAIGVVGVEPKIDDIGASNIYILDLFISPASESGAINEIVRMYVRNGVILQLGVEKVGITTTHVHVANALRARGRYVSEENGSLVLLRPAGRTKQKMIESALSWPLNNGKMHIVTSIPYVYRERLKMEMDNFPYWSHDDGLNMLAYLNDMIRDYAFPKNDMSFDYAPAEIGVV